MIGLYLKFCEAGLIRSILNNALFRVDEVQDKKEEENKQSLIERALTVSEPNKIM